MIVIDCEQGTEEWFAEKAGKPSASHFSEIITSEGKPSKSKEGYLYTLAAEAVTGKVHAGFQSASMTEGIEREEESRRLYEMLFDVEVKQVGMCYPDEQKKYLCSPDGIVNNEYGLELKNVIPKTQVAYLLENKLPAVYYHQVQGSMLVTGFDRWDFCTYSPGLPPLVIHNEPNKEFLKKLKDALESFVMELATVIGKLRGMQ